MKLTHLDLAILGACMSIDKDDLAAEQLYARALPLARERYGDQHPLTGLIILELQDLLERRGASAEAQKLEADARAILIKAWNTLAISR